MLDGNGMPEAGALGSCAGVSKPDTYTCRMETASGASRIGERSELRTNNHSGACVRPWVPAPVRGNRLKSLFIKGIDHIRN